MPLARSQEENSPHVLQTTTVQAGLGCAATPRPVWLRRRRRGDGGDGGFHFGVHARSNTTAEDLLDHWNDPERLQSALGLSAAQDIDGKRVAIAALLASAGGIPP